MKRRIRWPLRIAGVACAALLLWLLDLAGGALGCGRLPVRVRGVAVDARTGVPVQGASVLTLFDPEILRDPAELEEWRDGARMSEGLAEEDLIRSAATVGSARTGSDGAFEIIVGIGISHQYGLSGIRWITARGSAFVVARALLVEREGYAPLVHETKDARWEERQERKAGEIVGTLDVGTIRLEPARSR